MAQYHARPSARIRSPPPSPLPDDLGSSSLLFPSLPAAVAAHPATVPPSRYRSQTVSSAFSSASELSTSAASDWSLILPAPASSRTASQHRSPAAGGASPGSLQPSRSGSSIGREPSTVGLPSRQHQQQALGLPSHDGRGNFTSPGISSRPLIHHRTQSDLSQTSLGDLSADDYSSLSSTDLESSSASDPERSPALSPLALVGMTRPVSLLPPVGAGDVDTPGQSSADSSPSQTYAESLSRVPTIVDLSRLQQSDTAGFRSTVSARTTPRLLAEGNAASYYQRRDAALHDRLVGLSPGAISAGIRPSAPPDDDGLAGPLPSSPSPTFGGLTSLFSWPFGLSAVVRKDGVTPASTLSTALWCLRSLLALDEDTLLVLFSPPLPPSPSAAAVTSLPASPRRSDALVMPSSPAMRPRLVRRRSSSEPGTDSRRALLLLAVSRMTGQLH